MKPYPHQITESKYNLRRERALLWDMRTGKSKAALDAAYAQYKAGLIDCVLIVAPNGVHHNWARREVPLHMPGVTVLSWDSTTQDKKAYNSIIQTEKFFVFCVSHNALLIDLCVKIIKKIISKKRIFGIFDESHHFRTPGARKTKRARSLAKRLNAVRILTGTLIAKGPENAYSQFELLRPGILGFRAYAQFKNRFCEIGQAYGKGGRCFTKIIGPKNESDLKRRMAPYSSVVLRDECDMPKLISTRSYFELSQEQDKLFHALKQEYIVEAGETQIIATEAIVRLIKLQQITNGFVMDQAGKNHVLDSNPRLDLLLFELEQISGQAIIWCRFQYDIDVVKYELSNSVQYDGRVNAKDREKAIEDFQSGRARYFVAQPQSAGEGLRLDAANTIIWYSHNFDSIVWKQARERASITGKKKVDEINLTATTGIDEKIMHALQRKVNLADDIAGQGFIKFLEEL